MAISDVYAAQYLLEGTLAVPQRIAWREQVPDGASLITELGGVEIVLEHVYARTASHLMLRFRDREDEYCLREPTPIGWFGRRYSSEDDRSLAELLRKLMRAAMLQCQARKARALENPELVRDRIYRRLLFEQPAEAELVSK